MTKFSSKILEKIKKDNVTPRPRWHFILTHILLGTAILSSMMIGGIATAIVIRHLALTDWELARQFTGGHMRSVLLVIPYIWLILLGLTILMADSLYKQTKKGHRLRLWQLIIASVILSFIFGGLFFFTNADQPIESTLTRNLPAYAEWKVKQAQIFVVPEKGVIAGEIVAIDENEKMTVIDFKKRRWIIENDEMPPREERPFEVGMQVGIIGKKTNQEHFRAIRIAPWRGETRPSMRQKSNNENFYERKF